MVSEVNYVTCPKCGHDRNPSTAAKCEICGQRLKPDSFPLPALLALVALLLAGIGGYLWWQNNQTPATVASAPASAPASTTSPPALTDNRVIAPTVQVYDAMAAVPNVPSGLFNYGGSTTFAPLRSRQVLDAITAAQSDFRLRYTEPTSGGPGSGAGIAMLINGQLSVAQSSRSVKESEYTAAKERGFSLEQVPVAIDGIAFFVNPDIEIAGLSLDQVAGIFTGKVTNWNQVGGPNLPVVPFSRDAKAGGTVDFVREEVLGGDALGKGVRTVRDTTEAIRKVASTSGGIGFATASEVIGQRTIRPLPLARTGSRDYQPPFDDDGQVNGAAFRDGSYPVTRRLFVVIRRDGKLDEQAGAAYANLLLSGEGQRLVEQAGFVPIR